MRDFTLARRAALAVLSCTSLLQVAHAQTTTPAAGAASAPPAAGAAAPTGAAEPAATAPTGTAPPPEQAGPPPEPTPTAAPPPEPAPTAAPPPEPPPPLVLGEDASADQAPEDTRGPFSRGAIRLTLLLGTGSSATDQYFILGGGVGYYLLDGLEVGFDYEAWLFGDPVMHRLSPELRYVFHMVPVIKPYIGTFYRHTFVTGGYDDLDYVGGRVGVFYIPKQSRIYLGGGAVYERLLDCDSNSFVDCDTVYPEIAIGVSL
jgi:hypothetical protein